MLKLTGIRSLVRFGKARAPLAHPVLYPRRSFMTHYLNSFAENQLSPGLIGLSPLATSHPLIFQHQWVRSSSGCYPTFNCSWLDHRFRV